MVEKLKNVFLKKEKPFTKKRDLKTGLIKKCFFIFLLGLLLFLSIIPDSKKENENSFNTTEDENFNSSEITGLSDSNHELARINQKTLDTLSGSGGSKRVPNDLGYLYLGEKSSGISRGGHKKDSSMIIQREDLKNALPISFRILLSLPYELKVDDNSEIPVSALVVEDVFYRERLVIPKGSSFFGYTSLIHSERVQVKWHLVQFPNGIQRKIEALCLGVDKRLGIPGKLSGNFSRNLAGNGLSKVVGAYARGSMETTVFGQNRGGHKNGLRNAAAQAATEYGENLSENMRKKIRWITVASNTRFYALVTKPFVLGGVDHD